jgi:hypothetical protein
MEKAIQYIFKILITGIVVSFVVAAVLITIETIFGRTVVFDQKLLIELGYYLLYGVVLSTINGTFFDYLNHRVVWRKYTKFRLMIGAIGSIMLTMLGIFFIRIVTEVFFEGKTFEVFIQKEKFQYYVVALLITIVMTLIFHLIYYYKKSQENKLKEQKVIAGTASAQFESLKNQIDPHFLFNSLNVLSSLIEENPENAQKFTTSLSKIYRYVLEQKDKELISVEEELKFAKTYMNLLKMRFENSLSYEVPTEFINPEAKVVPLSLQLLLENTIKHNIVSENKPLRIKIYIENNYLIVENNLQKKEVLQERKGVGLQNIVNRYGLLSARKVLVEETSDFFRIKIPILTKQIVIMETQNIYNENMAYIKAKERVENLKGFYSNLISYCCVIPLLIFINLRTSNFQWFWFPMLGWGLGLTFHAFGTFGYGKSWEEKKIREIMNKENKSNQKWN